MAVDDRREADLILPPGVFAFVQDDTKGNVNVYCGPIKQSLSGTDRLVVIDPNNGRYRQAKVDEALQSFIQANTGFYVVLRNPAMDGKHPEAGRMDLLALKQMKMGQVENLPGPQYFPLWPGQTATTIRGHHLRSNQYLTVRVYDEAAARDNWNQGVVKMAAPVDATPVDLEPGATPAKAAVTDTADGAPASTSRFGIELNRLFTGLIFTIKGTEVNFYIPPTGIEVLPERETFEDDGERATSGNKDPYIRDAVTLERLEYCILLEEDGNKRYMRGPEVVFPMPTEQFVIRDGKRKFKAYELSPTSGLYIKVIADYEEDGESHKAGQELFITGTTQAIYYPRQEHAIIAYGDERTEKYHAIAIPAGDGRYVLDRTNGNIRTEEGPAMFMPNPINEVVVLRVLSDQECNLLYPGNAAVLAYNRSQREKSSASTPEISAMSMLMQDTPTRGFAPGSALTSARRESSGRSYAGDTVNRGTTYTPPRTVILGSDMQGAVKINVWTGYAIRIVNPKGDRRTIEGPGTVLLAYDEHVEPLSLSTGTPKNPDKLLSTVFLRITSNTVSDSFIAKTKELVDVEIKVHYLVRFDGDSSKWFDVNNYVQYMADHMRSLIRNHIRGLGLQEFYASAATILRDLVLGAKIEGERPLRRFEENNMVIYDLEPDVSIGQTDINKLLVESQQETLKDSITLEKQVRHLVLVRGQENAKRDEKTEIITTSKMQLAADQEVTELRGKIEAFRAKQQNDYDAVAAEAKRTLADLSLATAKIDIEAARQAASQHDEVENARQRRTVELIEAQTAAQKAVAEAFSPNIVSALVTLSQVKLFEASAQHLAPLALVRDQSLATTLQHVLAGTPLEKVLHNLQTLGPAGGASKSE